MTLLVRDSKLMVLWLWAKRFRREGRKRKIMKGEVRWCYGSAVDMGCWWM